MLAEVTAGSWIFSVFAVLVMIVSSFLCTAVLFGVFLGVLRFICGMTITSGVEDAVVAVSFFIGFMTGMMGGGWVMLQFAIWLGFRHGDLPTLPKF